ncbi:ChrR-like anti-ECFsigma factor [Shimia abyssi]|uniref:ChrR-like anti-ECFsigma factor n=2 Tax=Shimia abyssi TaxID=1662395 RepID=A0A2P8FIU3_9RHOB|nr:ChrR-like anti-ECFsigma factor [Shimia abyssi]
MQAYAAGTLPRPFAIVVAAHVSMCDQCRAVFEAHESAGGAVLEDMVQAPVDSGLRDSVLELLDVPVSEPEPAAPVRSGVFPGPVVECLHGRPPRWRKMGMGVKQCLLEDGRSGSVRLLHIPAGQAVPDHSHNGLELTLVLQGSFSDETGRFGVGDVEIGDEDLEHTPIADAGPDCICLAATDAPLRFNQFVPRMLQPIFRI